MRQTLKRFSRRKGFTIVECIIAIAVFALLALIIMMIITHARNSAVKANRAEEDLTGMINNIVGDDSYKKFYKDSSESLVLQIDGSASDLFTVSYNTVSGYRDYLIHDGNKPDGTPCNYSANRTAFMYDGSKWLSDPTLFDPSTCTYKCPECTADITSSVEFKCEDCLNHGGYAASGTTGFGYDTARDCYYCNQCDSTAVLTYNIGSGKYVYELVSSNVERVNGSGDFNITGMYANAIKYSDVMTPCVYEEETGRVYYNTNGSAGCQYYKMTGSGKGTFSWESDPNKQYDSRSTLFKMYNAANNVIVGTNAATAGSLKLSLIYTSNQSHSSPGEYELTVSDIKWAENTANSASNTLQITFPPYYDFVWYDNISTPGYFKSETSGVTAAWVNNSGGLAASDRRVVSVTGITGTSFKIKFRLKNYKSGYALEYDYNKSGIELKYRDFGSPGGGPDGNDDDSATLNSSQGLFAWFGMNCSRTCNPGDEYAKKVTGVTQLVSHVGESRMPGSFTP